MLSLFWLWHFCDKCEAPTGRLQILYTNCIKDYMEKDWLRSRPQGNITDSLVTIRTHSVNITTCMLEETMKCSYNESDFALFSTQCDYVSTLIDGKKIILWFCVLRTHTCKPGRLERKIACHQNTLVQWRSLAIFVHVTSHSLRIIVHVALCYRQ